MNKAVFKNIYPRQVWTNENYSYNQKNLINDERFGGGFLVPFIAGAAISAPFWLVAGSNKAQQQVYYQPPAQPYPMYYPYQQSATGAPTYYPYPPYR